MTAYQDIEFTSQPANSPIATKARVASLTLRRVAMPGTRISDKELALELLRDVEQWVQKARREGCGN